MKFSGRNYTKDLNKLETIRQDPYYKKIPNEVQPGSNSFKTRYLIDLNGELDENTSVNVHIQKEPNSQEFITLISNIRNLKLALAIIKLTTHQVSLLMWKNILMELKLATLMINGTEKAVLDQKSLNHKSLKHLVIIQRLIK